MSKIFISYRRDDSKADARSLRDRLATAFGRDSVFMDVDNLLAGQVFDEELARTLAACDVVLAVIGPRWLPILEERARRGAETGERDYVREEIAAALERDRIVIPVLIDGTPLPRADQLPLELRPLLRRHKHDVTHERFGRDVESLVAAIRLGRKLRKAGGRPDVPVRSAWGAAMIGIGAVVALAGGGAYWAGLVPAGAIATVSETAEPPRAPAEKLQQQAALEAPRPSAINAETPVPGTTFRDCPDCPEMVVVPAGNFVMGSPDSEEGRDSNEGPQRTVTIAKPFAVGKFEVTWDEWAVCVAAKGCDNGPVEKEGGDQGWGKGRRPVINVSWDDAKAYTAWLSKETGQTYRLLSESEWEYAARAGTTTPFSFGATISADQANYDGNATYGRGKKDVFREKTVEAGSFPANDFRLHDMHGNVWEWVEDCWIDSYRNAPSDGTARTTACTEDGARVLRGGSWDDNPWRLRWAGRLRDAAGGRYFNLGFRVGRTLSP